jgi:hypothetical protein
VNPASELLLAYLRKAQERNDELAEQNRLLRIKVCQLRESRDKWKARSTQYQRMITLWRGRAYNARQSRELWKHRATRQEESHADSGRTSRRIAA